MRRSSLTLALQTQPKGGSASCGGNFKTRYPVPVPCRHITTLLLFSESLSLTRRPRTSGSMLRVYCGSARSVTRTPCRCVAGSLVLLWRRQLCGGSGAAERATHSTPLSLVSLSVPAPVAPPIVLWMLPRQTLAVMPAGSDQRVAELVDLLRNNTLVLERRS